MIAIIDYGMGNLASVLRGLQRAGGDARIVTRPEEVQSADKVILPGVGAFRDAIARLRDHGLAEPLKAKIADGTPMMGICLGLQMLLEASHEDGRHVGLGVIKGEVVRFGNDLEDEQGRKLSVPHMGWNRIFWDRPCPMLSGIEQGEYVYFAHSYYVAPTDKSVVCTRTEYGGPFTSSVWADNVFAVQFHPEKSQAVGRRLLENFVRL